MLVCPGRAHGIYKLNSRIALPAEPAIHATNGFRLGERGLSLVVLFGTITHANKVDGQAVNKMFHVGVCGS